MKKSEIVIALIACAFAALGATMKTRCAFRSMSAHDAEQVLGGQPANCFTTVTNTCPGGSGDCSPAKLCQNNMCLTGPEIDTAFPGYQDAAPALIGWTDKMEAEGLYCQIQYNCNCALNDNGVNACNKLQPGTYQQYEQPDTVTDGPCPGS